MPDFKEMRVWVVGDIMLDRYLVGEAERISPEVPVPVVSLRERASCLGGAANVAHNIATLGGRVTLFGITGCDRAATELAQLIDLKGINAVIFNDSSRPTTVKTRVVAGRSQLLRLDEECVNPISGAVEAQLLSAIRRTPIPDVIIVSDYFKGTVTRSTMIALRELSPRPPLVVDPKRRDLSFYRGCEFLKPNLAEAARALGCARQEVLAKSNLDRLREVTGANLLITCGEEGLVLALTSGDMYHIPTDAHDVFDVTGAGDTIIATFALALAAGRNPVAAARLANHAAGIAIARLGTHAVTQEELLHRLPASPFQPSAKVLSPADAERFASAARRRGQRVVFTNGCFDVLHAGHVHLLATARRLGDCLIVGLNSDDSVRRLKGPQRPLNRAGDRAAVLAALDCVTALVVFDEDTPERLLRNLRPHILVKGDEYRREQVVGGDFVTANGGDVVLIPMLDGRSSSDIVARLPHGVVERAARYGLSPTGAPGEGPE